MRKQAAYERPAGVHIYTKLIQDALRLNKSRPSALHHRRMDLIGNDEIVFSKRSPRPCPYLLRCYPQIMIHGIVRVRHTSFVYLKKILFILLSCLVF